MNTVLPARYDERIHRLALGIEPIDAQRGQPMLMPVTIVHDDAWAGAARQPFERHPSNRQVLRYDADYAPAGRTVVLRLLDHEGGPYDPERDHRRFVPRRLRIALPALADAEAAPPAARGCRPHLYAGAAYPASDAMTGLRAHVFRAPAGRRPLRPARWVRLLATVPAAQPVLAQSTVCARAMGDDRGEFLLVVRHHPAALGTGGTLRVRLRVFAPLEAEPSDPDLPGRDPLWDLPLETPDSLADDDAVLRGEAMPAGYTQVAERVVDLPLGRLLRGQPPLKI